MAGGAQRKAAAILAIAVAVFARSSTRRSRRIIFTRSRMGLRHAKSLKNFVRGIGPMCWSGSRLMGPSYQAGWVLAGFRPDDAIPPTPGSLAAKVSDIGCESSLAAPRPEEGKRSGTSWMA